MHRPTAMPSSSEATACPEDGGIGAQCCPASSPPLPGMMLHYVRSAVCHGRNERLLHPATPAGLCTMLLRPACAAEGRSREPCSGRPTCPARWVGRRRRWVRMCAIPAVVEPQLRAGGRIAWRLLIPLPQLGCTLHPAHTLQTASRGEGGGAGKFGVYPGSSTFDLVKANAAAVQQLASGPAASCSKQGPPAAVPCADKG